MMFFGKKSSFQDFCNKNAACDVNITFITASKVGIGQSELSYWVSSLQAGGFLASYNIRLELQIRFGLGLVTPLSLHHSVFVDMTLHEIV